jgi:D-alanyl-D-alanine carboxypeptidase (penicillin-binding protein 5/6)
MKTKKLFVLLFLTFLILYPFNYVLSATTQINLPSTTAEGIFLLDNRTNKVLYSRSENKKMYPASTTKILTAIIVLENCNLNDVVSASYNAVMSIPNGYSTADIQIGEELTVEQLLELLLVCSANDAANVLAEYVGGSIDSFVSMMNTKLNELSLTDSHFTNAFGMQDENHYTTAHDLAFIMKYCLKNDTFRKIAGQASCAIPATNKSGTRTYTSTNELLIPETSHYYSYLTTGKTGFTTQAKECLVSSAYRDNLELICVVLGSNDRFADTRNLYEYAYSNYSIKNVVNEKDVVTNITVTNASRDTKNLDLLVNEMVPVLINNSESISEIIPEITLNENISAPIEEGTVLGKVKYSVDGVEYTTDLIASHYVKKSEILTYIFYACILIITILLIYGIFFHKNKNVEIKY